MTKAADALLQKVDPLYPFGTPPSEAPGLGDAGPPLVERPPTIPQHVLQLYGATANISTAPTAWQQEQVGLLEGRVKRWPPR